MEKDYSSFHSLPKPSEALSSRELYEFDLNGYIVLKKHFNSRVITEANKLMDEEVSRRGGGVIEMPCLHLDKLFLDMMVDKKILKICNELIGRWFRFENDIVFQCDPSSPVRYSAENLHGGQFVMQGSFWYKFYNGRPRSGPLVFGIVCKDVKEGDGGFVAVPGSHNSNFNISGHDLTKKILKGGWKNWEFLRNPALREGDLLIFTEALIHGSMFWKPKDRMRRILYYRYCPGHSGWQHPEQMKKYRGLARNVLEKRLLEPQYVGTYDDRLVPRWKNKYRPPTLGGKGNFDMYGEKTKK